MSTAWLLPIEPITARYTEQWFREFPKLFSARGYTVRNIVGETLSDTIDVGSWLPMNSTVVWKNTQVSTMARAFQNNEVKNNDIIFVYDTEHWGIESLKMMAEVNKVNVRIYSFLHAGSYTKEDLMEPLAPFQKYTELGWVALCDKVFVGSKYHKQAFIDRRIKPYSAREDWELLSNKLVVTGNPIFEEEYSKFPSTVKKNQIILPNRFDFEKRPNISLNLAYIIKKQYPNWNIVVTTSNPRFRSNKQWLHDTARYMEQDGIIEIKENLTKYEYHKTLSESKVMLTNSIEENFGYCIIESLIYNTYPLAPYGLSHTELLKNNPRLLYNDLDEVVEKIEYLMQTTMDVTLYARAYYKSGEIIVAETDPQQQYS